MSVPTTRVLVGLAFGLPALASHSSPSAPSLAPRAAADTAKRAAGLPLQPARYARFTTSQGTWISLDVSPDGQTIVFDLLGDLELLADPVRDNEGQTLALARDPSRVRRKQNLDNNF